MPIRFGLLGASRIAVTAVIGPARDNGDFTVTAVAARDPERAGTYGAQYGIPAVAADYAALIARDDVDVVYNALPPAGHAAWTIAALEAGKAVLCEKPFARDAVEARAMVDAAEASGQVLLEAFHYRFHNVMRAAVALVREGALGPLKSVEAVFEVPIARTPGELRWSAEQGGGALMDLGTYCVHAIRSLVGAEPEVTMARGEFVDGVDAAMEAELAFPGAMAGRIACSMVAARPAARLEAVGEAGRLTIDNFLAPQIGCRFVSEIGGETRRHATQGPTTYAAQLSHLAEVLAGRTAPLTGGADAIANMAAIDAIYRAAGRS
ncbi:MAG TPA: Gfo/Idh/MocA family oxidoreductase [Caulobacteraceae bacterium]|nr:Gfo/Idh/MocA family oxidoreductase [Caulobacteraceae bacterium]